MEKHEQTLEELQQEFVHLLKEHNKLQEEGVTLMRELYTLRKTLNYFLENGMIPRELGWSIWHFHSWQVQEEFDRILRR